MLEETMVFEFTKDVTVHNAILGYNRDTGMYAEVPEFRATAGQWAKINKSMARLLIPRYARDPFAVEPEQETSKPDLEVRQRPQFTVTRQLPRPKPAMDQSRIGRRGANAPGTCGHEVWNRLTGTYEPCALKRHHRDQCRSQAQIDTRAEQQRERRRQARGG